MLEPAEMNCAEEEISNSDQSVTSRWIPRAETAAIITLAREAEPDFALAAH